MGVKAYWKSIFVDNWQTTSVGLTTMIATAINYAWLWHKAHEMPSPEGYVAPFVAALFLVFRATDPPKTDPK